MSNKFKKLLDLVSWETFKSEKIEILLLVAIIFTALVPIRYVFPTSHGYILDYFSDFTAISIYTSQILIIVYIVLSLFINWNNIKILPVLKAVLTGLVLLLIYQLYIDPSFKLISAIFYLKLSISGLFIYCLISSNIWLNYKVFIIKYLVLLGSVSVIIGLIQFSLQHSIGLNILGEPPISILTYGVAKIVAHGTTFIRIYGFLPHPNILAGILVMLSLLNLYLLNNVHKISSRGMFIATYYLSVLGMFLCFSRGGIIAFAISTTIFAVLTTLQDGIIPMLKKLYFIPLILITLIFIFYPWYQSKNNLSDQSVLLRSQYNQTAIKIVKTNWLLGTGAGTNLLHMKQGLEIKLEYWDIQPVHNYFLIVISEFGIIGIIWIIFLIYLGIQLIRQVCSDLKHKISNSWRITLISITIAVFILMQIDHYFYTNWSAQVILCFIIAWIYKETHSEIGDAHNNVSRET